jgi:hypothetical protein
MRKVICFSLLLLFIAIQRESLAHTNASKTGTAEWNFAVSGDSRNCGDVVMPEIAAGVLQDDAQFYWHLGDFRAIYTMDEDFVHQKQYAPSPEHGGPTISSYLMLAWPDFIEHQIQPFGSMPVFLGIGNHEITAPKSREEFLVQFSAWLNSAPVQRQRALDYQWGWQTKTYYHWKKGAIDFINLDNGSGEQFDAEQMNWFETILAWDAKESSVKTIVVGMHKALPDSLSESHSMNETATGTASGRRAYLDLLKIRAGTFLDAKPDPAAKKRVYVLASHSHYFMRDIYRSSYWTQYGIAHGHGPDDGVLDGWIVGTAGAVRYQPPPEMVKSGEAIPKTYGYLLGTVENDGEISFGFKPITLQSVTPAVKQMYPSDFIQWCFDENPPPYAKK